MLETEFLLAIKSIMFGRTISQHSVYAPGNVSSKRYSPLVGLPWLFCRWCSWQRSCWVEWLYIVFLNPPSVVTSYPLLLCPQWHYTAVKKTIQHTTGWTFWDYPKYFLFVELKSQYMRSISMLPPDYLGWYILIHDITHLLSIFSKLVQHEESDLTLSEKTILTYLPANRRFMDYNIEIFFNFIFKLW